MAVGCSYSRYIPMRFPEIACCWVCSLASLASRSHVLLPVWRRNSDDVTQECGLPPPEPPHGHSKHPDGALHVCLHKGRYSSNVIKCDKISSHLLKYRQISSNHHLSGSFWNFFWTSSSSTPILRRHLPFFHHNLSRLRPHQQDLERRTQSGAAMDPWMPQLPPQGSAGSILGFRCSLPPLPCRAPTRTS